MEGWGGEEEERSVSGRLTKVYKLENIAFKIVFLYFLFLLFFPGPKLSFKYILRRASWAHTKMVVTYAGGVRVFQI